MTDTPKLRRRRPRWVTSAQASSRRATIRLLTNGSRIPWARPACDRLMRLMFDSLEPAWDAIRADPIYRNALHSALDAGPPASRCGVSDGTVQWPGVVLDVACGTGLASSYIKDRYPSAKLLGVDISPRMVAHANAKVEGLQAVVGSGSALPFASGSMDLVMSLDGVFDAGELARVCSPDGAVLIVYSKGGSCPVSRDIDKLKRELTDAGMTATTHRESWWAVWSVFDVSDR